MRICLAVASVLAMMGTAIAQDIPQITVRPLDDGRGTGPVYYGPYGRDLPGVSMFAGRAAPATPDFAQGGVKLPSGNKIANEYTYSRRPLPPLDAWHGTLSPGFAF
ncbi:MAG: hypothetical protein ROR55_02185 [Devosia sp.]